MKAEVTNHCRGSVRVAVRAALDGVRVEVREVRSPHSTRITHEGIALDHEETYSGRLPLDARRGAAILGIHDDQLPRRFPNMRDGHLSASQLSAAAAEFDGESGDQRFTAEDFVRWLASDIVGTPEHARESAAIRSLLEALPPAKAA